MWVGKHHPRIRKHEDSIIWVIPGLKGEIYPTENMARMMSRGAVFREVEFRT